MGDNFYLALSDTGLVYSWGDGDFGKLGRGGSDPSKTPRIVDKLQGLPVEKIFAGNQFSLALCKNGAIYSWGKGDHFRLGHGSEDHVRFPKLIEGLLGKRPQQVRLTLFCALPCNFRDAIALSDAIALLHKQ